MENGKQSDIASLGRIRGIYEGLLVKCTSKERGHQAIAAGLT
jgi:hypothetical protein